MPFVGIPSFLKLPIVPEGGATGHDFTVVGIPFDEGTSSRPGARYGPRAVRAASTLYSYEGGAELFDVELGRSILKGASVVDSGDVAIEPANGDANRDAMTRRIRGIVAAGSTPVAVGGDHSITASILKAFPAPPYLVHLDAHMDFDSYLPRHTHGTPVRLAVEQGLVAGVVQVGVRGLNNGRADWLEARERGVTVVTAEDYRLSGVDAVLAAVPSGAALYVSIDIDAFDPGIAPGTGTPEPGGLSYVEGRAVLRAVAGHGRVVGCDLVEVNPLFDHGEITAILAARLLLDLIGAIWEARIPRRP